MSHTFHIPVLGLGFSIDTPLKVARYGISSAISIVDDELIERIREYHTKQNGIEYIAILKSANNARARRITAYLNLMESLINQQVAGLKKLPFEPGNDLCRYFELLPDGSQLKQGYELMIDYPDGERKTIFQNILRHNIKVGSIDVNIMAKVDKMNFTAEGEYLGDENTDALAALRGFAESNLKSSVVLSAGMNPRLYGYLENFDCFLPDSEGRFNKKIILKVSDFRSALIQAKFLAKKGLWVSEFRVESGLNCGGHAFATEGYLLGPILEEFKQKREAMIEELFELYKPVMFQKGLELLPIPAQRISVQGGIGTADENNFIMDHYRLDGTGWGSPFLLVPEVTNVDDQTLNQLTNATQDDFYLSGASPLGILFNNFKQSSAETQRLERLEKGRPGSPCTKKYLCTNTEFTEKPICTASREYQNLKIKQIQALVLPPEEYNVQFKTITEKLCLCEGLCSSTYIKYDIVKRKENRAVAICPGPNLAYFTRSYSLEEMVMHIYGKIDLLKTVQRPNMFIKEIDLYIDYLKTDIQNHLKDLTEKKKRSLEKFKLQLHEGLNYYKALFEQLPWQATVNMEDLFLALTTYENKLNTIVIAD
ncbi:MAG: hypothetical protein V4553_14735 [Bacteroidota bacterium]